MTKSIYSKLLIFTLFISAIFQSNAACNWSKVNTNWSYSVSGGKITVGLNMANYPCVQQFWSLSGGTSVKASYTTFNVTKNGVYKICMKLYDTCKKCDTTVCREVKVDGIQSCTVDFTATITRDGVKFKPNFPCNGKAVYSWKFGNGTFSSNADPFVTYKKGTYEVCLTAKCYTYNSTTQKYDSCESKICKKIVIKDPPCELKGDFTFKIGEKGEVTFEGSANEKNVLYYWVIDNNTHKGRDFKMVLGPGVHKICLTIYNQKTNCKITICKTIEIPKNDCKIDFVATITKDGVKFKPEFKGCNGTATYTWYFGNGSSSTNFDPFVQYKPGTYEVCLYAKCSTFNKNTNKYDICESKICKKIVIKEPPCELKGDFTFKIGDKGEVVFVGSSNQTNSVYEWTIDGKSYYKGRDFKMTLAPGVHKICLTIFNQKTNCKITICKTVEIKGQEKCNLPKGWSQSNPTCSTYVFDGYKVVDANNNIITNPCHKYSWTFGDGTSANGKETKHEYKTSGTYTVCMKVIDTCRKCDTVICNTIKVDCGTKCTLEGGFRDSIICNRVFLIPSSNSKCSTLTYRYTMISNSNTMVVKETKIPLFEVPNAGGTFKFCLYLTDNCTGCKDTICKYYTIKACCNTTMNAEFSDTLKLGGLVRFVNLSTGGYSYKWLFGDGSTSTDKNISHTYANAGGYKVCLIAYDSAKNCTDTFCKYIQVSIKREGAASISNTNSNVWQLYPNPVSDEVTISGFEFLKGDVIFIKDITGKIVKTVTVADNMFNVNIKLGDISPGIYNIECQTIGGQTINSKLIKQ